MELDDVHALLGIPDPEILIERICAELVEVYRFNSERHEPDAGDDAQTFGFNVYRNSWARVEEALGDVPGVWTGRPNNSFEIVVPGARLHLYRGGSDDTYDIHLFDLGTASEVKASLPVRNERQLSLFDDDRPPAQAGLPELVLVHCGNADQGLTGVWVGAPRDRSSTGSPWAWVVQLFRHGDGGGSLSKLPATPPVTPYDQLGEPDLVIELASEIGSEEGPSEASA